MSFIDFVVSNKVALLAIALGISEGLALLPSLKGNGIIHSVVEFFKKMKG